MQTIKELIQKAPPKKNRDTEIGELYKFFMDTLNPCRVRAGYQPLKYPRMGMILKGQDKPTLYYMKSMMKDMDTEKACKWFWYAIRPQEDTNNG